MSPIAAPILGDVATSQGSGQVTIVRGAVRMVLFGALVLGGLAVSAGVPAATNLIKNGDFANVGNVFIENVGLGGDDLLTGGGSNIPSWTNVTPPGAAAHYANEMWVEAANSYSLSASPGNGTGYFVDLTGQSNTKPYGGLEQKVATTPGMGYTLTFALGASTLYNSSGTGAAALTASATGTSPLASHLFTLSPTSTNQWVTETLTFIADSDSTTIELLADSNYTSEYVGLDNVELVSRILPTTTTLSAPTTAATQGAAVALTALVKPTSGTVAPTGKVTFKSGTTTLGTVALNGTGQAVLTTTTLAVGTDVLTAVYSSDAIYGASTSKAVDVKITAAAPALTLSPKSLAFGDEMVGSTSALKTVTVTNSGTANVTFKSIGLAGSLAADFGLTKTCGTTLAAKASCTLSVTFKPVSAGAASASVSLADNVTGSPQTIALTGTGVAADDVGRPSPAQLK
jgi:hypothetical protein